jgi:hypothetical protein
LIIDHISSHTLKHKRTTARPRSAENVEKVSSQAALATESLEPASVPDEPPLEKGPLDTSIRNKNGGDIYWKWILFTTVGSLIGFGISAFVIYKLDSLGGITWSVLLLGLGIGGMQWLILRGNIQNAGWWILATTGGWALAVIIAARLTVLLDIDPGILILDYRIGILAIGSLLLSLILGAGTGTFQWLVLRNQTLQSSLWIPISMAGWVLGLIAAVFVGLSFFYVLEIYASSLGKLVDINPSTYIRWPVIFGGVTSGLIAGAVTGTIIRRIFQSPHADEISEPRKRIITF